MERMPPKRWWLLCKCRAARLKRKRKKLRQPPLLLQLLRQPLLLLQREPPNPGQLLLRRPQPKQLRQPRKARSKLGFVPVKPAIADKGMAGFFMAPFIQTPFIHTL
jgi:hypothetical protein